MSRRTMMRGAGIAAAAVLTAGLPTSAADYDWLSLCSKCLSPTITSKSGIGTANAVAEARITHEEAAGWCANWTPDSDQKQCVREQLDSPEAKETYRASADCTRGRITAIDGNTYTLAGTWTSDIGKGRTKWRDAGGHVVGQDNASNGLAISQQWEVLCPGVKKPSAAAPAPGTAAPPRHAPAAPPPPAPASAPGVAAGSAEAPFAVGQRIEAKYGRDWIPGRVTRIHPGVSSGPEYDVQLDNGARGVVPARMLRSAPGR